MLSDRSYMRDSYGRTSTSFLTWTLCALTAGFLIQIVFERAFESAHFSAFTGLSGAGLESLRFWTVLTYPLVHANVIHWLINLAAIYFLGKELIPLLGERHFLGLSAGAALGGAAVWLPIHWNSGDVLIGATAITCALLALFACLHPNRPMTFLFFFIPVTLKPKFVAWAVIAMSLLGLLGNELAGNRLGSDTAHSAHLGGLLVGFLYYRWVHLRAWKNPDGRAEIELPSWMKKKAKAPEPEPHFTVNISPPTREDLRAEVDRILDKINDQGFAALTPQEKRLLDDAREQLSRQ